MRQLRDGAAKTTPTRRTMNLWPDAANILGLGKTGAYEAAHRGEIPGLLKIGGRYLVSIEALNLALSGGQRNGTAA